ncbi:MAG: SPOR domain-containing protein [Burkholderiales bacterium]
MSRDYKSANNSKSGSRQPMLLGFVLGLFTGLAISMALAFYIFRSPSPYLETKPPEAAVAQPEPETGKTPGASATGKEGRRFDFYEILPGTEELVPEQDIQPGSATDGYYLQVGSFRSEPEADHMKAQLALLGLEGAIFTAEIPEKGVWHRVRVGPYTDVEELSKVRDLLAQNNIPATPLKVHTREP